MVMENKEKTSKFDPNWEHYIGIEEGILGRSLTEKELRDLKVRYSNYFVINRFSSSN